jgi:hypothetical protein
MLTTATLCRIFRGATDGHTNANIEEKGKRFLEELIALHSCVFQDTMPSPPASVPVEACKPSARKGISSTDRASIPNPTHAAFTGSMFDQNTHAVVIQAQVRRYVYQRRYRRIRVLQQRLESIATAKRSTLYHIDRRQQRRLCKIQRKYDRKEEKAEQEYQKIVGIVHYLQSDQIRCQRESEIFLRTILEMKRENHRLVHVNDRNRAALECLELKVTGFEEAIHQLRVTCEVYRHMIHQLETRIGDCSMTPVAKLPSPSNQRRSKGPSTNRARAYETYINVNSVSELEEQCFHYRLVQDVYTVTPS